MPGNHAEPSCTDHVFQHVCTSTCSIHDINLWLLKPPTKSAVCYLDPGWFQEVPPSPFAGLVGGGGRSVSIASSSYIYM